MGKTRGIFITGIGTDVGKTLIATILTEALQADYWKPVQCGNLDDTDTDFVRRMISNSKSVIHPEMFRLTQAMSPYAAAKIDGVKIRLKDFRMPDTSNTLIIEGAGGLLVPLNEKRLVVDLIAKLRSDVIIVIQNYLGSINHSLLTIEAARQRKLNVTRIIFNGEPNPESEQIILRYSKLKVLGRIFNEEEITKEVILKYAKLFKGG